MTIQQNTLNKPLVCFTAGGLVIHQKKVLLVKHKKLGIWLAPGGHLEENELPHQAAIREVSEETGIMAAITSTVSLPFSNDSEYQPTPLLVNLHWVVQENYQARIQSIDPSKPHITEKWKRGCEKHLVWIYLMKPASDSIDLKIDLNESTEIGWFESSQIATLQTTEDIKSEIQFALRFVEKS